MRIIEDVVAKEKEKEEKENKEKRRRKEEDEEVEEEVEEEEVEKVEEIVVEEVEGVEEEDPYRVRKRVRERWKARISRGRALTFCDAWPIAKARFSEERRSRKAALALVRADSRGEESLSFPVRDLALVSSMEYEKNEDEDEDEEEEEKDEDKEEEEEKEEVKEKKDEKEEEDTERP
ncbi:hypothetical protein V1478_006398 [Vespula squamosa]|uniref:Uncharacterized protein n=1 Tax=Vespula squamosa TaxID=30214 RepID=A0ABD2B7R1_VESSQ